VCRSLPGSLLNVKSSSLSFVIIDEVGHVVEDTAVAVPPARACSNYEGEVIGLVLVDPFPDVLGVVKVCFFGEAELEGCGGCVGCWRLRRGALDFPDHVVDGFEVDDVFVLAGCLELELGDGAVRGGPVEGLGGFEGESCDAVSLGVAWAEVGDGGHDDGFRGSCESRGLIVDASVVDEVLSDAGACDLDDGLQYDCRQDGLGSSHVQDRGCVPDKTIVKREGNLPQAEMSKNVSGIETNALLR